MKPELSVVIPCYNEAKNIPLVLQRFKEALTKSGGVVVELILVDNNSKDDTKAVLDQELKRPEYAFARTVFQPTPGYGAAIKKGLSACQADTLAWTHGDIQTDPFDVFRAYEVFKKNGGSTMIIKGNRVGRPFAQAAFSFGMAVISSVLLRRIFFEVNAQPKLLPRTFLTHIENGPDDFSLDLFLLHQAKRLNWGIKAIDVRFEKRLHGISSWAGSFRTKVKTIWRTLKYIWKLAIDAS